MSPGRNLGYIGLQICEKNMSLFIAVNPSLTTFLKSS